LSENKKDEEIIEEADAALTTEEEETLDETTEGPVTELETTDEEVEEAPEEEELEEAFEEFAEETEEEEEPVEEVEAEKTEEVDVEEEAEEEEVIELETEPSEELDIPAIPVESEIEEEEPEEELKIPDAEAIEAEVIDDEDVLEAKPRRKKKKKKSTWPLFWIGLAVGLIIAVGAEILFTIPYWNTGASSPELYYAEVVILLIAFMLPGLFSRSILKGIFGGFILFVISFGLPFLMLVFNVIILNPMTPLLSSSLFAIDAYDLFKDMFNLTLTVQEWMKWIIGLIDLVIMFALTVIIVTLTTGLVKVVTRPKKKVGHWIGIPLLSIGIIVFTIFMPLALSSTYGIIHASTSFLAGSSYFVTGLSSFQNSNGSLETLENDPLLEDGLEKASEWFNISYVHYDGLRNIGVISFVALVAGQYRPLIEAGDQLALASLAFTQVLYPLFLGIAAISDSLGSATDNLVNFGTSPSSIPYGDKTIRAQAVNQTKLDELKASILATITSLEDAETALDIVNNKLETKDVLGAFEETEALLAGIKTESMNPQVGGIIDNIRGQLTSFKGNLIGFTEFINFTSHALTPTKEILWTSYFSLVGNEYLKNYDFVTAYDAYDNATEHVALIDPADLAFVSTTTLGGIFAVNITEGFSTMLEDLVALMDPLLNEQKFFAQTYIGLNANLDYLALDNFTITDVDYGLTTIAAVNVSAELTRSFGIIAQAEADSFTLKLQDNSYGSFFNTTGGNFYEALTDDFKAADFGDKTYSLVQVMGNLIKGFEEYSVLNYMDAEVSLLLADTIMQTEIATAILVDTPTFFVDLLAHWDSAISTIRDIVIANSADLSAIVVVTDIRNALFILHTNVVI